MQDKIMVLDAGQLREFDTPANLLRQEGSIFASMVDDTGAESAKHLREACDTHATCGMRCPLACAINV